MKHKIFCLTLIAGLLLSPASSLAVTTASSSRATAAEVQELQTLFSQVKRLLKTVQTLNARLTSIRNFNQSSNSLSNLVY
jgi:peptidoglycan hydrolase CwlO-like protein